MYLQDVISFQMKRMKQIEQEKDVLLQGLAAVDKAREWYLKQISTIQEKIKHLGRMGSHVVYIFLFKRKNIKEYVFVYDKLTFYKVSMR